ncbi:MAG: hypothetical protein ACPL5F_13005, partial [Moorellaceae bacterium]
FALLPRLSPMSLWHGGGKSGIVRAGRYPCFPHVVVVPVGLPGIIAAFRRLLRRLYRRQASRTSVSPEG